MQGFRDLKVYQLAYKLAMEIFNESKSFPKDERYSFTDQIRRSSRSVATNIAEGFHKRQYPKMFVSKLADADGETTETQVWLDFARDCEYLSSTRTGELTRGYEEVGKMLGSMMSCLRNLRLIAKDRTIPNPILPSAFCFLFFETYHPSFRRYQ